MPKPNQHPQWTCRHLIAVAILTFTAAISSIACGTGTEGETQAPPNTQAPSNARVPTKEFLLTLDSSPSPDHAGIFMAVKRGYFEEAGLSANIHTPVAPKMPVQYVAGKTVDFAISYEPQVVLAHDRGLNLVAVGAIVDRPLTSLVWQHSSPINRIADLRGKTIATAGVPYQRAYLRSILARAGLTINDVKVVDVGYDLLPALANGRADAILGSFTNTEEIDLQLPGKAPVVTPVGRFGVPDYDELVVIARRAHLENEPKEIRRFLAAVARGTAAAKQDPEAATEALIEADPNLNPELTRTEVSATLPFLSASARMNQAKWSEFITWMHDEGLIDRRPSTDAVLSNDYLAGEIPG